MKGILLATVFLALFSFGQEFNLKLDVKGFQVGEIHIGCKAGATAAYDKRMDIYVPPATMQGGTIGLLLENNSLPLYQDIRPPEFPQTWRIQCRAKSLSSISWDKTLLPEGLAFTIRKEKGIASDMTKITTLRIKGNTDITITASKKTDGATTAPEQKEEQK